MSALADPHDGEAGLLRPVVAAAIVDSLREPTKLLAARRSYPERLKGFYELPGGKVETGESPELALLREIQEELGVGLILGRPVPGSTEPLLEPEKTVWGSPGFRPWRILEGRVMWVWMAEVRCGEHLRPLGSHSELTWASPAEALELPWLPTNLPIVQKVVSEMGNKRQLEANLGSANHRCRLGSVRKTP